MRESESFYAVTAAGAYVIPAVARLTERTWMFNDDSFVDSYIFSARSIADGTNRWFCYRAICFSHSIASCYATPNRWRDVPKMPHWILATRKKRNCEILSAACVSARAEVVPFAVAAASDVKSAPRLARSNSAARNHELIRKKLRTRIAPMEFEYCMPMRAISAFRYITNLAGIYTSQQKAHYVEVPARELLDKR